METGDSVLPGQPYVCKPSTPYTHRKKDLNGTTRSWKQSLQMYMKLGFNMHNGHSPAHPLLLSLYAITIAIIRSAYLQFNSAFSIVEPRIQRRTYWLTRCLDKNKNVKGSQLPNSPTNSGYLSQACYLEE